MPCILYEPVQNAHDHALQKRVDPVGDVKSSMDSHIKDSGLEKFYGSDNTLLQSVAEKASALRNDPNETLNAPESIDRLTRLALYQVVLYCDDSGSMQGRRWDALCKLVHRITRIATTLIPGENGVELRFINSSETFSNLDVAKIDAAMKQSGPSGMTPLGSRLRSHVLQPLVYDVLEKGETLKRPLLIFTITDGEPSESDNIFRDAIEECTEALVKAGYERTAVLFAISQIGDDENAEKFLQGLSGDASIQDVLCYSPDRLDDKFKEFGSDERKLDEWLLETLTAKITVGQSQAKK